ncbi:ribonuclease P protein component [Corynebacterium sp. 320]|uniref:ribonuclease P protein component n=1 Tax=Corynebacterium TaxID=1716 RepID=UPI00125CB1C9|nr:MULTISPECIES: ribonuclease P protein component [Corynebacterium]KAB1502807.1 ribonuclease P protein component [Corynebacterium sp. 320]KAB1550451.1 ribonuclease P protein component [Corynebacterium sp. 319]KAB1554818.1 ribonuclease P protein component [Corynebacterium sp. 321]KAB3526470.1 ribonuclease P protein component [Corynebacterium sp. 250]KAB3539790.1 ribonuclease P protein component [Corynebacterium sp. 366]
MLPPQHRLRSTAAFGRTVKKGRKKGSATVVAYTLVDKSSVASVGGPRVGLIVSKAVGNAVARHHTSRLLRHASAEALQSLDIPTGAHIVLRALPASGSATYQEIKADVYSCIRRSL